MTPSAVGEQCRMVYHLRTRTLINKQANYQQSGCHHPTGVGQHPKCVPDATTRGLGVLLPGLSSTSCIFDGDVHTDIIASTPPKGTHKESRKVDAKWKKNKRTKGKSENRFNNLHTGGGSTAVSARSADTAPRRGLEQAIQSTKTNTT